MASHTPPHKPAAQQNPSTPHGSTAGVDAGHGADVHHESAIKTPRQLIIVVVLAFVVPILVIILLAVFMNQSFRVGAGAAAMSPEAIEARIMPVAGFELKAGGAANALRSGEEVYKAVCSACHAAGVAGAPKFGDKAAWEPRLKQGLEALINASLKGKGAMPPQGGGTPDLEVARAVVYLGNAGGGSFEEPKAPAAAPAAASK